MTAGSSTAWTVVDGLRIHALRWSGRRPAAPPIVLVHGLSVSSRYMAPTGDLLGGHWDVWALDLPGFGKSDAPDHVYSLTENADLLDRWLAVVGLFRPLLVGNSYGCQLIVDLVARKPDRACAVVLDSPTVEASRRTIVGEMIRLVRDIPFERAALIPVVARDYLRAGPVRTLRTLSGAISDRIEDKVPLIPVPALLVRGGRDPIVSERWLRLLAERMPRARVATIDGVGHAVNFSAPEPFARLIDAFSRELPELTTS